MGACLRCASCLYLHVIFPVARVFFNVLALCEVEVCESDALCVMRLSFSACIKNKSFIAILFFFFWVESGLEYRD